MDKTTVRKSGQLFGKVDILRYFFEHPEKEFHLRELARMASLSPSTISSHLSRMVGGKLIISRKDKGFNLYKSNTENKLYKESKLFYSINTIRKSELLDFLNRELNHPKA